MESAVNVEYSGAMVRLMFIKATELVKLFYDLFGY